MSILEDERRHAGPTRRMTFVTSTPSGEKYSVSVSGEILVVSGLATGSYQRGC
jgi:hypothetical protein